ncbi:spore germination protein [Cellulosilyticum sp. I15G10I2]|uniref:spore germination protein n=1 Tax=Cellulosilyticum sp. I15G10I2 TaxID=1892843 RepID=UPI00085C3626|nr:spore germination protein [Cellulosilyticum sp. I15G10I2]
MNLTNNLEDNLLKLKSALKVGESFDIIERIINIHGTKFYLYYLDGFVKDLNLEHARRDLYNFKKEDFDSITSMKDLAEKALSSIEVATERDLGQIVTLILSGQTAFLGPNFDEALLLDFRTYVARGTEEPAKERVLRGAHDGFVETIVFNTALIRRRIRDPHLIFKMYSVGKVSKTDVAVGFMRNKVDTKTLAKVQEYLETLSVDALTLGDQSLVEAIHSKSWLNPFPKVRYTERPDIAAAHIAEGKVVVLVDNTPTALILPTNIFDFMQTVDDYYMPVLTGNYLRLIRYIIFIVNLMLTPVFVLLMQNPDWLPAGLNFLFPGEPYNIPIFVQFLLLEIGIDGLMLASVSTPDVLGTSLSIIGGLILGDYAVKTGWLIPQAILYMAVVALSSFAQPSIELTYALKFCRMLFLLLTGLLGTPGFIIAAIITLLTIGFTKTFTAQSYIYPLIPFNWNALSHLLFRTRLGVKQSVKKN